MLQQTIKRGFTLAVVITLIVAAVKAALTLRDRRRAPFPSRATAEQSGDAVPPMSVQVGSGSIGSAANNGS